MVGTRSRLAQSYYDMATLLEAGVPILRSVDILIEGRQGPFKRVFVQMRESLSKGSSLSESMERQRHVFPELDRMLVQAAETAGSLGDSFKMLSQWHEFVQRITRRMQMGLVYPFFILHIAAFVVRLPDYILGKISLREYLLAVLGILSFLYIPTILVVVCIRLRDRIPLLRLPLDFVALHIPVLGQAIYHMSICRYAKAFGMLYAAGVPMTETTERATRATGNVLVARQFAGARETVRQGAAAWEGFSRRLPAEYRHLWQIGEETGDLDKVAAKVADISGERADLFFNAFATGFPKVVYFVIMLVMVMMVLRMWSQIYGNIGTF